MSRGIFLRLFIGLFGVVFIVLTFWLSVYFHLSISTKIVIVLVFALATIFAELVIAIDNLEKRLKAAFPSLELSLKEQVVVNETIMLYNKLKKKKTDIATQIAVEGFEKIHYLLKQAEKGGDFTYHDIYAAKMIILGELKPGQCFKVASNLTEPFYWKSGKDVSEHTKLNYRQAKRGIRIERIFILKNEDDYSKIEEIMEELMGISLAFSIGWLIYIFGALEFIDNVFTVWVDNSKLRLFHDLLKKLRYLKETYPNPRL